MRKSSLLGILLLILLFTVACGAEKSVDEEANQSKPQETEDMEEKAKDAPAIEEDPVAEVPELTEEEAKEVVYDFFLERMILARDLMDEKHEEADYQLYYDQATKEHQDLISSFEEIFAPIIVEDKLGVEAALFAEINTCECSYPVVTPNQVNVRFELMKQTDGEFTASFIKLGDFDEANGGKTFVTFGYEDEMWKFVESDTQPLKEKLQLEAEDFEGFGFNFATYETIPMAFVEYSSVDGAELIIMEKNGEDIGFDVDTGEMHLVY